jgi:hypothetical protein
MCLFCERPWMEVRKSFEHIWRQWLREYSWSLADSARLLAAGAEPYRRM